MGLLGRGFGELGLVGGGFEWVDFGGRVGVVLDWEICEKVITY